MSDISKDWHWTRDGQTFGPLGADDLRHLLASGQITPATMVWHAAQGDWRPYHSSLLAGPGVSPPPIFNTAGEQAYRALQPIKPTSLVLVILLGIITFGLYAIVMFYSCAARYFRAQQLPLRFAKFFWPFCAASAAALAIGVTIGVKMALATLKKETFSFEGLETPYWMSQGFTALAILFGGLTLHSVMEGREPIVRGLRLSGAVMSGGMHLLLWLFPQVASLASGVMTGLEGLDSAEESPAADIFNFFGLIIFVIQAIKFFLDHNTIALATQRARGY